MYIGVDGCTAGWIAVQFDDNGYEGSSLHEDIEELWTAHGDAAEELLIDVPIGLRDDSNAKRPCDDAAREKLSPNRHSSVFFSSSACCRSGRKLRGRKADTEKTH